MGIETEKLVIQLVGHGQPELGEGAGRYPDLAIAEQLRINAGFGQHSGHPLRVQAMQCRLDKINGYRVFLLHGPRSWLIGRLKWQKISGKPVIFGIGSVVGHL